MKEHRLLPFLAALTLVACSSETTGPGTTDTSTTTTTTTVADTSTTVSPTTTEPCATTGDLLAKGPGEPLTLSSLIGYDIRVEQLRCVERITIQLQGTGDFPGWAVEYVDDPVPLGMSGETTYLDGDATLLIRMGMWMQTMEGVGYQGPLDIRPSDRTHVLELRLVENWEGVTHWAIGLDTAVPFTATVLHDPERLVIDLPQ